MKWMRDQGKEEKKEKDTKEKARKYTLRAI
jgi:hypothetical protein